MRLLALLLLWVMFLVLLLLMLPFWRNSVNVVLGDQYRGAGRLV